MQKIKKYFYISILLILWLQNQVFAWTPKVPDLGLPADNVEINEVTWKIWWNLIDLLIKYVAIIAVISLMISWIMYLISGWEEEKVKKAKNWIIWSLVWVLISISAYGLVGIVNNLTINN